MLFHIRWVYLFRNLNLLIQHLHLIVQFFEALATDCVVQTGQINVLFINHTAILSKTLEVLLAHHELVRAVIAGAALCRRYIYWEVHLNLVVTVVLFAVSLTLPGYGAIVRQVQM